MYSREVNGKQIAWIEDNPLSLKDLTNYKKVAAYIANHIGEAYTILESGNKVYLGESLPNEYTQSEYTKALLRKSPKTLTAKNKAIGSFGEMIEIATNRRWEKAKHAANKDAKYGVYRYSTAFAFPVRQNGKIASVKSFDAELVILNSSDGKKYLYDIVNIKKNTADGLDLMERDQIGGQNAPARRGASENSIRSSEENVNEKFSREVKDAEEYFGTTYKIKEAGYICTDGKMLDFSGRHEGAPGGYRTVDHRDITDALGEDYGDGDYSGGMVKFMSEGNIRVSPEIGGINLSAAPNKSQRSTLDRYISSFRGEVVLDIDNTNGDTVASVEYPKYTHSSVVLKDIDDYFNKGKVPEPFTSGVKYSLEGKNKDGIEVYTTSEDVRSLTRKERQKKFLEIMQNEYRGRTAKFNRNGHVYYATFDSRDVNKNIYGDRRSSNSGYNAKLKVGADGNIFELVENSKYDGSKVEQGKNTQSHKQVRFWDYFVKTVQIDNEVFDLLANVRRKSDGDYVYSIQLRANKSIEASAAQQPNQKVGVNKAANASDNSISSSEGNVKASREPETLNELRRQNEQLRERVDYWKRQTKPTKVKQLRMDDIRRLAKEVVEMSETDLKPKDITEGLTELGKYLLNEKELRYTDVSRMAEDIAADVIENATAIANEEDTETHNGLKNYLRRVKLRDDGSAEFESIRSSYKRRIMFDTGRKRYEKKGLGVDTAYMELHDMFGEGYFPEDIINPADQLERIAEVLDNTAPRYANPNGYYAKEATEFLRNYIIDSMLGEDMRQAAPTYADKAEAKLAATKAEYTKRINKAVANERQRGEKRLQRLFLIRKVILQCIIAVTNHLAFCRDLW